MTERLLRDLSVIFPDLLVVSGLAYGIDICAHRNALKNQLPTVGVLAHGLDRIYPPVHRSTAVEMLEKINRMLALKKKLAGRLQSVLGLGVNVKLVEPRSIERSVGKAKRVIDNRKL